MFVEVASVSVDSAACAAAPTVDCPFGHTATRSTVHGLQQSQQVSIEFGVAHESPPWWRKASIPETLPTENPEELKKFCVPPNIQPKEYSQSQFLLNFLPLKEVACSLTPNIPLTTNW